MALGSRVAIASLSLLLATTAFADGTATPTADNPSIIGSDQATTGDSGTAGGSTAPAPEAGAASTVPPPSAPAATDQPVAPGAPAATDQPAAPTSPAPSGAEAAPAPAVPSPELAAALARIDELGAQIKDLSAKLDAAEGELGAAQKSLEAEQAGRAADATASQALQADLFAATDEANAKATELQAKLEDRDKLADRLASLEAERDRLSASLDAERSGHFSLDEWPKVLVSGFQEAKPRIGSWAIADGRAAQTNPREFFSRLDIPLEQRDRAYLYRFSAQSSGPGWVGLGIHFFASGVNSKRGYGEGRSLLVWLTRDPAVRKSDATWLQLYRSDTDVVMERVLDSKLEEGIGGRLEVEVAYDPSSGYVSVAVNDRLAVKYRAWFGIDEGVGVSLRTLGAGASFSDFEVRSSEP